MHDYSYNSINVIRKTVRTFSSCFWHQNLKWFYLLIPSTIRQNVISILYGLLSYTSIYVSSLLPSLFLTNENFKMVWYMPLCKYIWSVEKTILKFLKRWKLFSFFMITACFTQNFCKKKLSLHHLPLTQTFWQCNYSIVILITLECKRDFLSCYLRYSKIRITNGKYVILLLIT